MDSRHCRGYHHDRFDEMDAFNPASIAAEWRRESSSQESVKHNGNGLLRRFHFKEDGIPKVVTCEFEMDDAHQCNSQRSFASDSSSACTVLSSPRPSKSRPSDNLTERVAISSREYLRARQNSTSTTAFSSTRSTSDFSHHLPCEQVPRQIDENMVETPRLADKVWNDPSCATKANQHCGMSSRSCRTHESAPGLLEFSSTSVKGTKRLKNHFVHSLPREWPVRESMNISERPKSNNSDTKSKYVNLTNKTMKIKSRSCNGLDNSRMPERGSSTNGLNLEISKIEPVRNNSKYMDTLFAVPYKRSGLLIAHPGMQLSKSQPYQHFQNSDKSKSKSCHGVSYLDTLFGS
jgi:hypothetical protein